MKCKAHIGGTEKQNIGAPARLLMRHWLVSVIDRGVSESIDNAMVNQSQKRQR